MLEGPLSLPSLQDYQVNQIITMFLMSSLPHLRSGSPGSHRVLLWQNPGHANPKGPTSGSSLEHGGSRGVLGFTPLILGQLLQVLEEDVAAALVLHLQDVLSAFMLLSQLV